MRRTRLIESTADLKFDGVGLPGCPMLLVHERLEPVPSLWLAHLFTWSSPETAWTYACAIEFWWRALLATRIAWHEATQADFEAWSFRQQDVSGSTVLLRLTAVEQFYRWAQVHGHIEALPFRLGKAGRAAAAFTSRSRAGALVPVVRTPRVQKRAFSTTTLEQFTEILARTDRKDDGLRLRDELLAEAGRFMGLRRSDAVGLTTAQFLSLDPERPVHAIVLAEDTTKGRKERAVIAPRLFVRRVQRYIGLFRSRALEQASTRGPRAKKPQALFLTRDGRPVNADYVSHHWRRSSLRAGIPCRFHTNRHSYATTVASMAVRRGEDALLALRDLLGHSSLTTTVKYIHRVEMEGEVFQAAMAVNDLYEQHVQGHS